MKTPQVYFFLGSGGVGKTTCAASFALALEIKGLRTVVMTVDPARRLAQALGLKALNNEAERIVSSSKHSYLDALWLNNKDALKDLARKHISSSSALEKVLKHPFFSVIENQLGGIEEYLGVEKALSLVESGQYDACVIDTPPSQHALDFLESPKHLQEFFDDTVLKFYVRSPDDSAQWWKKLFQFGQSQALEVFRRIVGKNFFTQLADLLLNLRPVYESLKETAQRADALFSGPNSVYVLVSSLENDPVNEAQLLHKELRIRYPQCVFNILFNRCLPQSSPLSAENLSHHFGVKRGAQIFYEWQEESKIRAQASSWTQKHPLAELPRLSIRQIALPELELLGEEIHKQWNAKSVNQSPKL